MKVITYNGNGFSHTQPSVIENYKLSAFCIDQMVGNSILLCHTMTGALILLTEAEYAAICSGKPLTGNWAKALAQLGFLPETNTDEYAQVDEKRVQMQCSAANKSETLSYTILPTSRCNARCFYCYESGLPQKNMTQKTAEDVASFIIRNNTGQKVHLGWFGGEPTISHPIITLICQRLREKNVEFHSGMISNGLLMDETMICKAKEQWHLQHIQITLDGTQSIYNATKNYKGKVENPYLTVLSNIDSLLNANIRVCVRINLGLHNFKDTSLLIQQLTQRFSQKKGIAVYVHEIDNYYSDEAYLKLMERTAELNEELIQLGLQDRPELPSLRLHSCMADNNNSVLINPDGQLGKCEHYVFDKLHGSIYSDATNVSLINQWKETVRFEQCGCCPFYASCLRLKWCNGGGFFCREGMIQSKIAETRHTMLQIYEGWKIHRLRFWEKDTFQLVAPYEIQSIDGQLLAVFLLQGQCDPPVTIPANQTVQDILDILQQPHTLRDIVEMLEQKYDTSGFAVGDIVEEYLMSIIRDGLCIQTAMQT